MADGSAREEAMNLPATMTLSHVVTLLCSGLEGGSNYWLRIDGYRAPETVKAVAGPILSLGETIFRHIDYPLTGGAVECLDMESGEQLVLDREAIERGARLMVEKETRHWGMVLSERDDATQGDVFVQLCLLGEVVYG